MMAKLGLKIIVLLLLLTGAMSLSANPNAQSIEDLVKKAMQTFQVPGVAIGIIKHGKIIHQQGYGIANLDTGSPVDENTIFKIASNSKAFTAAALAILVDQGKLNWDDKVIQYLPDFQMYDSWVTKEFNILDLLTHRSGLRIGAGDLMLWPEPTKFSREEVVKNLRYLKPVTSFRNQYAYDNLLYIVAGEVIASISGQSWEAFIESNIFKPLGMENCFAGGVDTNKYLNLVTPHLVINNQLKVDHANLINDKISLMAAAGGIKCSASDLLKWLKMLLNGGIMDNGQSLISLSQRDFMWKAVTRLPLSSELKQLDNSHYRGYALGWRVGDTHGEWKVSHTGSLSGSMSQIIMLPDHNLGIVVLTNQQSSAARNSLARGLLQEFIEVNKTDWVAHYVKAKATRLSRLSKSTKKSAIISFPEEKLIPDNDKSRQLLGNYIDPWFGEITLAKKNNNIIFQSKKSPRLKGTLYFYKDNQWWVKWHDRSFEADAWLYFNNNATRAKVRLLMKPISSATDFSFDFEDLDFKQQ